MTLEGAVSVQEALAFLVENRRREDGKAHTDRDIADALKAMGTEVSYSAVWQMRTGGQPHPRTNLIQALACFFRVPAGFFLDREVFDSWSKKLTTPDEPEMPLPGGMPLQRGGSPQHLPILLRTTGMSDRSMSLLDALAAHVSELEAKDGRTA
ncbi:hypothetical protein [Amycolatopsis sp. cmx-4-54]|uniref:hypothetical protein n=1 Tax=Amycolatopsis sp. cmx-4-54 TaxID=2790936 RepID=UPI00397A8786